MFSTLRKFLIIFLTMLQFIAPLVHAHASEPGSKQGLHIPGLEYYGTEHNTFIDQMKTLQCNACVDGMIAGVNPGLKPIKTPPQADSDDHYYLHQQTIAFNFVAYAFNTHFSPQPEQLVYRLLIPSPPSRAPPATIYPSLRKDAQIASF
jgi:hypothetical protein